MNQLSIRTLTNMLVVQMDGEQINNKPPLTRKARRAEKKGQK